MIHDWASLAAQLELEALAGARLEQTQVATWSVQFLIERSAAHGPLPWDEVNRALSALELMHAGLNLTSTERSLHRWRPDDVWVHEQQKISGLDESWRSFPGGASRRRRAEALVQLAQFAPRLRHWVQTPEVGLQIGGMGYDLVSLWSSSLTLPWASRHAGERWCESYLGLAALSVARLSSHLPVTESQNLTIQIGDALEAASERELPASITGALQQACTLSESNWSRTTGRGKAC